MNYCGYCLHPHSRDSSGCCPQHARKVGAAKAAATRRYNRIMRDVLARAQHRAYVAPHWRQLALGMDGHAREHLRAIFNVEPPA